MCALFNNLIFDHTLDFCHRFRFSDAFAFCENGLDPHRISSFLSEFGENVLITGRPSSSALPSVLSASSTIKYTGVVHLMREKTGLKTTRYERIHSTSRPNGKRFPQQCVECRAYFPWHVPKKRVVKDVREMNQNMVFHCDTEGCSGTFEAQELEGYQPLAREPAHIFSKSV
jgi:hypothetical protein